MTNEDYVWKEQVFLDVWNKFDNVNEIVGPKDCANFLCDLVKATDGQVTVDFFSGSSFDEIQRIEKLGDHICIYWKDFEKKPLTFDWMYSLHDDSTYVYTLCSLRKISIINHNKHLYILIQPNVTTIKEMKRIMNISNLQKEKDFFIFEDSENLSSNIIFRKNEKNTIVRYSVIHFIVS